MSIFCKYCTEAERKQDNPGLVCDSCSEFVHLQCLKRPGTPGDFTCDIFFDYTCEDCSPSKTEVFTRNKFPWVNVILMSLHHMSTKSYGISNNGFFHYKTHICCFIDRNWLALFGPHFRQKKNWVGTIAGALSVYSQLFFRSGTQALGESGWWRLMHNFSPAVAAHIVQELSREKLRGTLRNQIALDKKYFIEKVTSLGYKDLISVDPAAAAPPSKKRKLDADNTDPDTRPDVNEESQQDTSMSSLHLDQSGVDSMFPGYPTMPIPQSDSSSMHSYQQSAVFYDSDSRSRSPHFTNSPHTTTDKTHDKKEPKPKKTEEKPIIRETLFSTELNSIDMPWVEEHETTGLVEMTPYEEIQLLKQVESMIPRVRDPDKKSYLQLLKAKLALRRLKRHKHLPIFDFDKTVKLLAGHAAEDPKERGSVERVLDRFQRSYLLDSLSGTVPAPAPVVCLLPAARPAPARSPYSALTLKPFIRRDHTPDSLWLRLMDELLAKTNKQPGYSVPARGSLDYSYVAPHHVPAVNALAAHHFWPGIDLTEALEYPEFSVVVSYKRIVVACAFLVPDAHGRDAYVTFILTRSEWRRAGIASFMLYHLLQTCTGKDVTLHVSPTNPAIFLYQKFGFKVEELIQDFYEKYYDIDYKGCRHALFLRLVR